MTFIYSWKTIELGDLSEMIACRRWFCGAKRVVFGDDGLQHIQIDVYKCQQIIRRQRERERERNVYMYVSVIPNQG